MTNATMTIRDRVEQLMEGEIGNALRRSHEGNYETLYVTREGYLYWREEIDSATRDIDDDEFAPMPHLIQVGTGSISCNCDWCQGPNAVEETWTIDFATEEYSEMYDRMLARLTEIPVGYFDDETEEEEAI